MYTRLSNEELIQSYRCGNNENLQLLLEQNKALIYKVAKRFFTGRDNAIDQEDLIQEGYIGLIKAVEKYNEDIAVGFITYAYYWIYQAMHRFMYPTRNRINSKSVKVNSLNAMISGVDDDIELQETLADEDIYPGIEESIANKEDYEQVEQVLTTSKRVNPNALQIIRLRYGFNNGKCYTLEEIATALGLAKERVRYIQENAFREIRRSKWGKMRMEEKQAYRASKMYNPRTFTHDFFNRLDSEVMPLLKEVT